MRHTTRVKIFFRNIIFFCGIFFIFLLLGGAPVSAQVILNEVYANPDTGESEWVELWNSGEETIDLAGWQIWDQLATPKIAYQFPQNTPLAGNAYRVIELNNVLNNGGDEVVVKDAQGQEKDRFAYASSTKGVSWSRDTGGTWYETDPSPNQPNQTLSPTPSPSPLTIFPELSEIMACPTAGGEEWVELFNPHSQAIPLAGFSLRDDKNQVFAFSQESISAKSFLTVELKNVLNNTGDSVILIAPDGKKIDEFSYTTCTTAHSWAKIAGQWLSTELVTKNNANLASNTSANTPPTDSTSSATTSQTNTSASQQSSPFTYPSSVLRPHLAHEGLPVPTAENIAFGTPPRLERGALSVIMGGLLLLIPGFVYAKKRANPF